MIFTFNPPSNALVDWAATEATGIRLPLDRPWYQVDAPNSTDISKWTITCRCSTAAEKATKEFYEANGVKEEPVPIEVALKCYKCEDDCGNVFLGQCKRCEVLVWAYQVIK